ncbi:MAG: hypothetical protein DMD35_04710 [Gemmatimonadetes bacterium]|nr:MAG: hypothetical protein DMD35_04710 [Gemmatimonadota bacterium]
MERAIEILAVIQLTIIGLSHIVHHRAWAELFIWLRSKGYAGVFASGFLSLTAGSLIFSFHHVWSGIPLVLTVFGLLNVLKAASCFLLPARAMRSMERVSVERSREFVVAGVVSLGIAGVVALGLIRGA